MADAITDNQELAPTGTGRALRRVGGNPIDTFMQSATMRHFGRLIGLALAIAVGTVVVLWTSEPNYAPLYTNVTGQDAAEIANVLTTNEIKYKIETGGSIMVAQDKVAEARLKLAASGLPRGTTKGLEMLQDDQGLGTSQFIESARYNHALETELARSIEAIRSVEQARVHLALPKQSIFIRNRSKPSASVVTKLYSGRRLNQGQVDAIVHMIAASIPMMEADQVTVVDQFGRLLTGDQNTDMAQTSKQFEYTRKLEDSYADRIIELLQPIVGDGKVNAEVSATLDFSMVESTREAYDPERSVIRSEQVNEQEMRDMNAAQGIPGALSNQPPGIGTTTPDAATNTDAASQLPATQNRSATRNFEVDRMISHTRNPSGSIQRLSVAVLIDSKTTLKDDGTTEKTAYTDEEIARFESLVKETIGFDQNRGDRVSVINQPFVVTEKEVVEVPSWQLLLNEGWIITLAKQVFGALGLLIVFFLFVRPFLRSLNPARLEAERQQEEAEIRASGGDNRAGGGAGGELAGPSSMSMNNMQLAEDPNNTAAMIRRSDATHEQKVSMVRNLVTDDPARVANVVKTGLLRNNERRVKTEGIGKISGLDKAALLMLTLGEDVAAQILQNMNPKQVQVIGAAMSTVENVTRPMVEYVIDDFLAQLETQTALGIGNDSYIRGMLEKALGDKAGNVIDRILMGSGSNGLEALKWMDPKSIAEIIRLEHPQIIAIVLSYLEPDSAAQVLTNLPENTRSGILMRIATLDGVQPAAVKELDSIMEKYFTDNDNVKSSMVGGERTAADILNFIDSSIEGPLIDQVRTENEDLANRIQDLMFVFDNLRDIDDRGIQTMLREISTDLLTLALKGVDEDFQQKFLKNMSSRAAEMLVEDMEAKGPVKLSEVEAAQKEILNIARGLEESGEISLGGAGEEMVKYWVVLILCTGANDAASKG